eukprot:GHVT01042899.1.p1 GENE.GHVT01042899.1~~GHVT01042899.1.p1  ORF type:complete len:184 (-),score=14.54 GHVT01042899.1:1677-2228(-)
MLIAVGHLVSKSLVICLLFRLMLRRVGLPPGTPALSFSTAQICRFKPVQTLMGPPWPCQPRGVRTHAPSKQTGRQPAAEGPVAKAIAGLKQRRENYARKGFPETRLLRTPREQRTQTQPETGEPSDSNLETALETNRHLCFQDGKRRLHCGRNQVPKTFIGWSDFSFAVAAYFHPNTDPPEQC